jgi:Mitochondrial carrier protein
MKRSRKSIGRLDWVVAVSLPILVHGWTCRRNPRPPSLPHFLRCHPASDEDECSIGKYVNGPKSPLDSNVSRRQALQSLALSSGIVALLPDVAHAAKAELDAATGNLFTPKAEMWSGGSDAARGIPIARGERVVRTTIPSIYETRFIAYLSRFLLNFDPAARAYWVQQGFGDSWERPGAEDRAAENALAEFAQSVEVGLADYFSGPFGSYASLPAIVAGINAAQPAPSRNSNLRKKSRHGFLHDIFNPRPSLYTKSDAVASAKQGILNLYTLLKARYNSLSAKRQLAILFSFVSDPDLQPVNEIRSLLGEADNATISAIQLSDASTTDSWDARTSSRHGGGYAYGEPPTVSVDSPPPLGDQYREAKIEPIMKPTSRVLRIVLTDGGEGYITAPTVTVIQNNGLVIRQCEATALLDREGHVESVFVLDPGYGYGGGRKVLPPKVIIEAPAAQRSRSTPVRTARAYAQLEYKIAGIQLVDGGTGFVSTEPPNIRISPPNQDPDWFINVQDNPTMRMVPAPDPDPLRAIVTEMKYADGNIAYSINGVPDRSNVINDDLLERIVRDPLELLPSSVRLELLPDPRSGTLRYTIPQVELIPQFVAFPSPRYMAEDPIFGGVGRLPVTKGASALTFSEYARLALSGAVCTVAVRTALNPLELIKTKQQLQNDVELMEYARSKVQPPSVVHVSAPVPDSTELPLSYAEPVSDTTTTTLLAPSHTIAEVATERAPVMVKVGTTEMIRNIVELRGPLALFQSADITFLASLVFGSFGFGATELFRRSFTTTFVSDSSNSSESELVLLLAASLATVLTALAASPFEVLRVRSMGLVQAKPWTDVLTDFLVRCCVAVFVLLCLLYGTHDLSA